jgi:hypothetical protein
MKKRPYFADSLPGIITDLMEVALQSGEFENVNELFRQLTALRIAFGCVRPGARDRDSSGKMLEELLYYLNASVREDEEEDA